MQLMPLLHRLSATPVAADSYAASWASPWLQAVEQLPYQLVQQLLRKLTVQTSRLLTFQCQVQPAMTSQTQFLLPESLPHCNACIVYTKAAAVRLACQASSACTGCCV